MSPRESHALSLFLSLSHSFSLTITHTLSSLYFALSLYLSIYLSYKVTHYLSLTLSCSQTFSLFRPVPHILSLSLSPSLPLSLSAQEGGGRKRCVLFGVDSATEPAPKHPSIWPAHVANKSTGERKTEEERKNRHLNPAQPPFERLQHEQQQHQQQLQHPCKRRLEIISSLFAPQKFSARQTRPSRSSSFLQLKQEAIIKRASSWYSCKTWAEPFTTQQEKSLWTPELSFFAVVSGDDSCFLCNRIVQAQAVI